MILADTRKCSRILSVLHKTPFAFHCMHYNYATYYGLSKLMVVVVLLQGYSGWDISHSTNFISIRKESSIAIKEVWRNSLFGPGVSSQATFHEK